MPARDSMGHSGAYTVSSARDPFFERSSPYMNLTNHQFRLAARPTGLPQRSDWNYTEEPVRDPGPGEVVVQNLYISLDPAMRGWMNEGRSYIEPVKIGEVMRAGAVGRVVASLDGNF